MKWPVRTICKSLITWSVSCFSALLVSGLAGASPIDTAYRGDHNPAHKLQRILGGSSPLKLDTWTQDRLTRGAGDAHYKKWVLADPTDLLQRSGWEALRSIMTIVEGEGGRYDLQIPASIPSPDYGAGWGRRAIYTELNPRALARMEHRRSSEGLLQLIKLLPAIPPSHNRRPHVLVLSQLYASADGQDSYVSNHQRSLYTINLGVFSENLCPGYRDAHHQRIYAAEQIKAFNDLAHLLGFKTGFRVLISQDQLRLQGKRFEWWRREHRQAFVDAIVKGANLGFDAIYVDSGKHVGDKDWHHYAGIGPVPSADEWRQITYKIRNESGKADFAIVGEKANAEVEYFASLGFTAGTDWGQLDNEDSLAWEGKQQGHSGINSYRAGPDVSNDNDEEVLLTQPEWRLARIRTALFSNPYELPVFMQMTDLFPLNRGTTTHELMLYNRDFSNHGPASHWLNLFEHSPTSDWYRHSVNEAWSDFLGQ